MSRAVVTWRRSGRPFGLVNRVLVMPMALAVLVMRSANACCDPEICSAMTIEASLADFVMRPYMASRTVIVRPARNPSLDGCWAAAWRDTFIRVSKRKRFA
jgi:hypothetical protein